MVDGIVYSVINTGKPAVSRIDSNLANVHAFEEAGKEIFGEWGCLPMIAFGKTQTSSAFKLLARARDLDFETANEISKQIQSYELDVKHAKENNADDPDYDVDEDVQIDSYIEDKYLSLIEESKKYKGIITSVSPHPCGHIVYHKDLRREIGVIRVKSKSGNKEAVYAAYIDGTTSDKFGLCKSDMLRVDVVKIISDTFKMIGKQVMSAEELVKTTKDDPNVWNILANGFTMGCNQTEREKTTQRVMKFKPKNTVELSALIAAIRPGAKSLVDSFVNRQEHTYGIPAMDELLRLDGATGVTGKSSFLFYDEQIMRLAEAAGIAPEDTNALIKHIKKKHHDEVLAYEEKFVPGFIKYLIEKEHVSEEKAKQTAKDVFTVVRNSASYLFNLSHAYAMNLDCLYGMYLKAYYPYEFYITLLKLYDEKKNTDKISSIISEMKRYKNIKLLSGQWGQNNTDWTADKENATISQSISSIKYMSKTVAEQLYELSQQEEAYIGSEFKTDVFTPEAKKEIAKLNKKLKPLQEKAEAYLANGGDVFDEDFLVLYDEGYTLEQEIKKIKADDASYISRGGEVKHYAKLDNFTNVLRAIQMNTCLDTRQIEILIGLNYFQQFGKTGKLMNIYNEFFNGEKKLTKLIKSFEGRLEHCRAYESSITDVELPAGLRLRYEMENIGLCLSTSADVPSNAYYVTSIDDKYTIKLNLYNIRRGTTGLVKVAKKDYHTVAEGSCIRIENFRKGPKYTYSKGVKTLVPGETEIWVTNYNVVQKGEANIA